MYCCSNNQVASDTAPSSPPKPRWVHLYMVNGTSEALLLIEELQLTVVDIYVAKFTTIYTTRGSNFNHLIIDKLTLLDNELIYLKKLLRQNILALDYCVLVKFVQTKSLDDSDSLMYNQRFLGGQHVQLIYHNRIQHNIEEILGFKEVLIHKSIH